MRLRFHPAGTAAHLLCLALGLPGLCLRATVVSELGFLPIPQDVLLAHYMDDIRLIEPGGQDAAGALGTLGKIQM